MYIYIFLGIDSTKVDKEVDSTKVDKEVDSTKVDKEVDSTKVENISLENMREGHTKSVLFSVIGFQTLGRPKSSPRGPCEDPNSPCRPREGPNSIRRPV